MVESICADISSGGINVALSLGSNIGDSKTIIEEAVGDLRGFIDNITVSGLYRTEPVRIKEQPSFLNAAVTGKTSLSPESLLKRINSVENKYGREREVRYGPRTLDIDIIFYGDKNISTQDLKIPHPEIKNRLFVMVPLCEIAPFLVDPAEGRTVKDILAERINILDEKVERL